MFPLFKLPGVLHWVSVNIDSAASASSGSIRKESEKLHSVIVRLLIIQTGFTNLPLPTFLVIGIRTRLAVVRMFFCGTFSKAIIFLPGLYGRRMN